MTRTKFTEYDAEAQHAKTSCDDQHLVNAGYNGCPRCNKLLLERLERIDQMPPRMDLHRLFVAYAANQSMGTQWRDDPDKPGGGAFVLNSTQTAWLAYQWAWRDALAPNRNVTEPEDDN